MNFIYYFMRESSEFGIWFISKNKNNSRVLSSAMMILTASIFITLTACSESGWSDKKENFTQTYMEILITRQQITDSAKAQNEVRAVMEKHGYNEQSFAQQFMEYSRTPEALKLILDSAQSRARREIKR